MEEMSGGFRRALVVGAVIALSVPVSATAAAAGSAAAVRTADQVQWRLVGTWTTATMPLRTTIEAQTIRMVVRTSIGGSGLRIRLSNVFGSRPVRFDSVYVGLREEGARIVPGTNRRLTFRGRPAVRVAPGRAVWSDPLPGPVADRTELLVSVHTPDRIRQVTGHQRAYQVNYLSVPGDYSDDETPDAYVIERTSWYFLDRVAVTSGASAGAVVAFGDSLTDGAGMLPDVNRRWTDYLFDRLTLLRRTPRLSVLNAGISGNRLLRPGVGPSALSRFRRDVLSQPGVRTVVIMEGINDIARGTNPSAEHLIAAYRRLIRQARAADVRVVGGTLTPFRGWPKYTPAKERVRQEVNRWIRTSGEFDAVADFDRALRDPARPRRLLAHYDSGDHLHMSDAGRKRMAAVVRSALPK